jgi:hypothetical protein
MSDAAALHRKLRLKEGRIGFLNPPKGYVEGLQPLPPGTEIATRFGGKFDWVQLFVRNQAELKAQLPKAVAALKPGSTLWISFPKGTSKIQTDLTRDKGWDLLRHIDLKWTNLISVDPTWSAFGLRPYKDGEPRQNFSWQS